jgi:hypothetical protein
MYYRVLHIPEEFAILIHPVPECHPSYRHTKAGRRSYLIFPDIEMTSGVARNLLKWQEDNSKRLYEMGHRCFDTKPRYAHNWRPSSDAAVGRRILNRESNARHQFRSEAT